MVQQVGLQLLVREDTRVADDSQYEAIRLAMLAAGQPFASLYPEYSEPLDIGEDAPDDVLMDPNATYDYSGVKWESPGEMSEDDLAEFMEWVEDPVVTIKNADLEGRGEWH